VNISDVFNLYAYEFKLYYSSIALNGTPPAVEGPFLESGGQTFFENLTFTDHYNSTYGVVWIVNTLIGNVPGVDGDGLLATIRFNATAAGNSIPLYLSDIKLSDPEANLIPYVNFDGTVTVLPEFTRTTALLIMILISIPILLRVRKMRKSSVSWPSDILKKKEVKCIFSSGRNAKIPRCLF
jgi:hypothetical protein